MKKLKNKCCKKFRKKSKACSSCPLWAGLNKKQRQKLIAKSGSKRKAA